MHLIVTEPYGDMATTESPSSESGSKGPGGTHWNPPDLKDFDGSTYT